MILKSDMSIWRIPLFWQISEMSTSLCQISRHFSITGQITRLQMDLSWMFRTWALVWVTWRWILMGYRIWVTSLNCSLTIKYNSHSGSSKPSHQLKTIPPSFWTYWTMRLRWYQIHLTFPLWIILTCSPMLPQGLSWPKLNQLNYPYFCKYKVIPHPSSSKIMPVLHLMYLNKGTVSFLS